MFLVGFRELLAALVAVVITLSTGVDALWARLSPAVHEVVFIEAPEETGGAEAVSEEITTPVSIAEDSALIEPLSDISETIELEAALGNAILDVEQDPRPVADITKEAIVNVFCQIRSGKRVYTATGSGVFIDTKGVVLTNAHVAQFLLLSGLEGEKTRGRCTLRTGSPAKSQYYAELLYLPPVWVYKNAEKLAEDNPTGTGEGDYALLYVTAAVNGTLPASFPAIQLGTLGTDDKNAEVIAAGYPAEVFKDKGSRAGLSAALATTSIERFFTYGTEKTLDLMAIAPSQAAQHGVSGGPIVLAEEKTLAGIIVTKGNPDAEGKSSLRAITLPYIDRTIKEETGQSLKEILASDLHARSNTYHTALVPFLSKIVWEQLSKLK